MSDIFISYRRKPSGSLAILLQELLKNKHGIDAYVDTTRTDSTRVQFPERLMQAIADTPFFLCLLADTTLESEWVRKEIQQAYELQKFCIPVFQESYVPPTETTFAVDYLLNHDGVHVLDIRNIFIHESVDKIAKLVRPVPTPEPKSPVQVSLPLIIFTLLFVTIAGVIIAYLLGQQNPISEATVTQTVSSIAQNTPNTPETPNPTSTLTPYDTVKSPTSSIPTEFPLTLDEAILQRKFRVVGSQNCPVSTGFTPDETLFMVHGSGIYRIDDGQKIFSTTGDFIVSPNGTLVAVSGDGVYQISTGQRLFSIGAGSQAFNPDGTLLTVSEDGVYQLTTGKKLFSTTGDFVISPDETLVAVSGDGIYEISTGQKLVSMGAGSRVFSPDGTILAVSGDGVYQLTTREKLFSISGYPQFSPDGAILAVSEDGVYQLTTGDKLFSISGHPQFSPDGTILAVSEDGVYQLTTGDKLFSISGHPQFSPDGTLLAVRESNEQNQDIYYENIYHVIDGKLLFSKTGNFSSFSPDSSLLSISSDGVYRIADGLKLFDIDGGGPTGFSADSSILVARNRAVYRVSDGQKLFNIQGPRWRFSEDGKLLAASYDGVYRLVDSKEIIDANYFFISFSPTEKYLAADCKAFIPDITAINIQGTLIANANLKTEPNDTSYTQKEFVTGHEFTIISKNSVGDWYYVIDEMGSVGWVNANQITLGDDPSQLTILGE